MTNFFLCDIGLVMNWKIWKRPVQRPVQLNIDIEYIEAMSKQLDSVQEIQKLHNQDLATINTAINRIERKQNRWLDVLNLPEKKLLDKENGENRGLNTLQPGVDYPAPAATVAEPGTPGVGDEVPDFIPGAENNPRG